MYFCQSCGQQYSKWMGQCQECGQWNTVEEGHASFTKNTPRPTDSAPPQPISSVSVNSVPRWQSKIEDLDILLGGGLVPGSVTLLGGEPGIGKSTLLLQICEACTKQNKIALYASGEESTSQIALRATRLAINTENLFVLSETNIESVVRYSEQYSPSILILDSIQTFYSSALESPMGSASQIRDCAFKIISLSKSMNISTFLVGHITKEGNIAGPKLLEHMVDAVLYFEGATSHSFRLLRCIKNRFGSTNELGIFEMGDCGLKSIKDPSKYFLSERPKITTGSIITASLEGRRPLLIEIQALVTASPLAMPRRTAIGMDPNRVSLLVAILEKRAGYRLFDQDVYVNVAGGIRISEPASDLAVVAALISSFIGKPAPDHALFFGEVGLGGEVRSAPGTEARLKEAMKIGLKCAYVPKKAFEEFNALEMKLIPVEHVGALSDSF